MRPLGSLKTTLILLCITSLSVPCVVLHLKHSQESLSFPPPCPTVWKTLVNKTISNHPHSCASRSHHQNSLRFPSHLYHTTEQLLEALSRYETMHSECYHNTDFKELTMISNTSCKYLIHIESEGLGNRLLGLISAFVYALLTNRVLLLDPKGITQHILCEPFKNSSWIPHKNFPYKRLVTAARPGENNNLSSIRILNLSLTTERKDLRFFKKTHVISMSTNLYLVPRFFTFPEFWEELVSLFPAPNLAFTHLSRHLLLPNDRVWGKINRFWSAYLSAPGRHVGVQIRLHDRDDPGMYHLPSYEPIMEFLVGNRILPLVTDVLAPRTNAMVVVLVVCLNKRYYEEMKKTYTRNPNTEGVQIHTFSHDGVQSEEIEQSENALAEMWLLSYSDTLVTSSMSTFGYIAQGIAGKKPSVKSGDVDNGDTYRACVMRASEDPCALRPFFRSDEYRADGLDQEPYQAMPRLRWWATDDITCLLCLFYVATSSKNPFGGYCDNPSRQELSDSYQGEKRFNVLKIHKGSYLIHK